MIANPPDISRAGFLKVMDEVLRTLSADPPRMGGSAVCEALPGEPVKNIDPFARVNVQLEGTDAHATSVRGQRVDINLTAGQCVYFAPHAWSIPYFNTTGEFFGVVFKSDCIRLIQVVLTGAIPKEKWSPWSYHTALPLAEAGNHMLRAMNCFAEEANPGPAARELLVALLHVVRQQLTEDDPSHNPRHRSLQTWQMVRGYLDEHFGREVTRESVAHVFDLHPNYLSALARQVGGESFHQVLESIRMHEARRLLHDTDLKLARIAALCGYRDATRFATVFRRTAGTTPGRFRDEAKN